MDKHKGILLESGTNEIEIVEFSIGSNKFGINVIKVKEIIKPVPVTYIPHSHTHVEGIIELRGEVLPVVDMAKALGFPPSAEPAQDKFIVAEFNMQKMVFHVHSVTQIHRISWESIEKPSGMNKGLLDQIVGIISLEGNMILLVDFEKIVVDINPEAGLRSGRLMNFDARERSEKRVLVAEDSPLLRQLLNDTLAAAGYVNLKFFDNGREMLDYLETVRESGKKMTDEVKLIITDIEMPKMDGLYLTKYLKADDTFRELPVIIFSSLITEDLRHKGKMVGADAQVSKPDIGGLINYMDQLIL
ncbi:two-component system chemotaxis response regulator CheV [Peribacillus deserti]|uniref:Two-component system chemotaxis response regulator CheV n=1 Tax=Peribacillus deserti TaxID=673318 RepID=A0ABS2QN86_9BACI|nr:chemotaxis protein [Peribacillus deserti]MBM7694623.1 two-component system chemotaxis response regulator CheV [Peribacillus deserti]